MTLPKMRYSDLKHLHFVDREDHEMGTLEDLVLDEDTFVPTHLILGSSFFEEFMEEIGERDNIDEIAPLEMVDHIEDDYIILSCGLEELETTDSQGMLTKKGVMFTDLIHKSVSTADEENIGELYDFILDYQNSKFIISLDSISERLLQQGYGQKFNIALPLDLLEQLDNKVVITLSSGEIEKFIKQKYEMEQRGHILLEWT